MSDYFYSLHEIVMENTTFHVWADLWLLCDEIAEENNQ